MSNTPDPRTTPTGPTGIPRSAIPSAVPTAPADACVNFNLPDGRVVCLSVPHPLGDLDAAFVLAIVHAHVTAVAARRGR
jgi:hypothetical protein